MTKLSKRPGRGTAIAAAMAASLLPSAASAGEATDRAFFNHLQDICNTDPGASVFGSPLFNACNDAFSGALTGGIYVPGAAVSNLDISSGHGSAAQNGAWQQGAELQRRLVNRNPARRGGGASADFRLDRLGGFASVQYASTDRDASALEQGWDSDLTSLLGGLDYRYDDTLVAGVALGYTSDDAGFTNNAGSLDTTSWSGTVYATYVPVKNASIRGYLGFRDLEYDATRQLRFGGITGTTTSDAGGDQWVFGVSGSFDRELGAWTLGHFINLDYASTDIGGYTERGNTGLEMIYADQSTRSLVSTLGLRLSRTWGRVTPELRVGWVHQYENDARNIQTRLALSPDSVFTITTDDPDRDHFVGGIGAVVETGGKLQVFFDYERIEGHEYLDSWSLSAGVLGEF